MSKPLPIRAFRPTALKSGYLEYSQTDSFRGNLSAVFPIKVRRIDLIARDREHFRHEECNEMRWQNASRARSQFMKTTLSDQLGTRLPSKIIAIGGWSRRTALADGGTVVIGPTSAVWVGVADKMDHRAAHGVSSKRQSRCRRRMTLHACSLLWFYCITSKIYASQRDPPVRPDRSVAENMSANILLSSCRTRRHRVLSQVLQFKFAPFAWNSC